MSWSIYIDSDRIKFKEGNEQRYFRYDRIELVEDEDLKFVAIKEDQSSSIPVKALNRYGAKKLLDLCDDTNGLEDKVLPKVI